MESQVSLNGSGCMKNNLEALSEYGNRIIDLTRRNRLLKFPKNSKSITFNMNLKEFLKQFGKLNDLQIEFNHSQVLHQEINELKTTLPTEEVDLQTTKNTYIPPTNLVGEQLIASLNALRLETKRKFEEHGVHTLFLAIGKVKWKEPSVGSKKSSNVTEKYDFNAPLLLVPINIKENKNPKKTIVSTDLEASDILANKVLGLLLAKEYKSRQLELIHNNEDNWIKTYKNLYSQVKEIFTELKLEYELNDEIQIGQYSFLGQQIHTDLHDNKQSIIKHEFINALCTQSQIQQENLIIKIENPDLLLTPENDYSVMDADRSQLHILQNAINGNHLNVQGPPGTGKSQTIVNLISNLLARNKTVLMVCEKQTALEVVLDRLKKVGLDKLCLPLFQSNTDRKVFAKSILEDRDSVIKIEEQSHKIRNLDTPLANREKKIVELRTYATALGEIVQPLNKSLHWVHGEWIKYANITSDVTAPWMGGDPLQMSFDEYNKLMDLLDNIAPALNFSAEEKLSPWKNIRRQYSSPNFVNQVNRIVGDIREAISSMALIRSTVNFDSIKDIRKLVILQELVDNIQSIHESSIMESDLHKVAIKLNSALHSIEQYKSLDHIYSEKYRIPFKWDHQLIQTVDNKDNIEDSIKISSVKAAALDSQLFKDHLEIIIELCNVLPVDDLTVHELLLYENILLIDPVIENVQHWDNIDILQDAFAQLNSLNTLNNQLNKAKNILDKWGITINDIEPSIALPIGTRFNNKYRNIFRYLCFGYHKDRKMLTSWCSIDFPQKHIEYTEIANAIKDFFKFENKFKILFETFNEKSIYPGKAIKQQQIPVLLQNIKRAIDALHACEKNYLPKKIMRIHNAANKQLIKKFYVAFHGVHKILNTSWDIFKFKVNDQISINELIFLHPSLQQSIENKLKLYEAVYATYTEKNHDYSVAQLKHDAKEIDNLFCQLEKIQQLNLETLFENNNIIESIINNPKNIKNLSICVQNLIAIIDTNINASDNPTVKQAVEYTMELRQILPLMHQQLGNYIKLETELNRLFENEKSVNFIEELSFKNAISTLDGMLNDQPNLEKWLVHMRYIRQLEQLGQSWFLEIIKNKPITNSSALFAQALWSAWLDKYYAQKPALQNFNLKNHKQIISEFKCLEKQVLQLNAFRIMAKYAPKFNTFRRHSSEQDKKLINQSQLKTRHRPIRKVVQETGQLLLEYKPCWMMSPLTLSSYIPYGSVNFDVVIFDEASQLRVEHSLPAIARAKQVIIFGDENQLPPTSFFENSNEIEDDEEEPIDNYESILHATKEILPGANGLLSHHYRSKYEDLIAFSNHHIYSDRLITFPNPNKSHKAIQFELVEAGLFDGGKGGSRRNDIEAKHVVEACIKQITEEPSKSLGVIAFSKAQEVAIRDALLDCLKNRPHLQALLDETSDSHAQFFIKNLESVQGDERDVIILSVGYGKDKRTGIVYNRFGPINSRYGYRRLNVAITRAKEKIICISSIKSSDIRTEKARGAHMLQKYLEYAERGIQSLDTTLLIQSQLDIVADSPFEEEVEKALLLRGYTVHRQIGASGFKIDLAIVNPKNDQEYVLGIECDGATYHSSYSARMNDRMRQEILERLGWKLYRIWSQHWTCKKEEIIDDIIRTISDAN